MLKCFEKQMMIDMISWIDLHAHAWILTIINSNATVKVPSQQYLIHERKLYM